VYDACGDPVYAAALARAILGGEGQAEEYFEDAGQRVYREPSMTITGSGRAEAPAVTEVRHVEDGDPTVLVTDTVELAVVRRVGGSESSLPGLTGTWDGQPRLLAYARISD
jgi:hypothetical protein